MDIVKSFVYDHDGLDLGEDDSDDNRAESSDDDIDIFLHGTPKQLRRLRRLSEGQNDLSSEDDFEKEMNKELQQFVNKLEADRDTNGTAGLAGRNPAAETTDDPTLREDKFYDDIYFDSDDEDASKLESRQTRMVISNDDLLYDPGMDDDDQMWVDRQRTHYHHTPRKNKTKNKPKLHSDAVLNCPACMTTVCIDCQRHAIYSNQYRAMFVMNCVVNNSEVLRYPKEIGKTKRKKKKNQFENGETSDMPDDDKFSPVKCNECDTVVAMYDQDEVYHFFNILASHT